MLIGLVALIVIGPERLPGVARTVGHLVGRLQRYVADVKSDINREVELDELRKMRDSVQEAAASVETSLTSGLSKTEEELNRAFNAEMPETAKETVSSANPALSDGATATPPTVEEGPGPSAENPGVAPEPAKPSSANT